VIVLDASVLIAHLDAGDPHHTRAVEALSEAAWEDFGASVVTVAEILVGPARADRLEAARAALRELGLQEILLAADAPARLATLRAETGLKLPDCCVLLAAQDGGAQALVTFDHRLAAAARALGFEVH
jgi:predicted nucleic acid-binding protein